MRYRVDISDKILGPFTINEIFKLYENGKVSSNNKIQEFPHGDWFELGTLKEFKAYELSSQDDHEETHMFALKNFGKESENKDKDMDEEKDDIPEIDDSPLEDAVEFNYVNESAQVTDEKKNRE